MTAILECAENNASSQCFIPKSSHTPPNHLHVTKYLYLPLDIEINMLTLFLS